MKILVTGAVGFIGFHLSFKLLKLGHEVVGIDNLNSYYDVSLKQARLKLLNDPRFKFFKMNLEDEAGLLNLAKAEKFDVVLNMAAQAGVRYSLENPSAYIQANLVGFANVLELCRQTSVKHLIYASSSSVYGLNSNMPFKVCDNVDHPISLYAATKKANELMAHTYSYLYNLPTTGLRFFTVYGPWGRPDMALFKFVKAILNGEPIDVYNHGQLKRDFTYIDDIVNGIIPLLNQPAQPDPLWDSAEPNPSTSCAPYRVYNIGNNSPVALEEFISCIETALGKKAIKNYLPMQPGDVLATYADVNALHDATGFAPATSLKEGVGKFVEWYKDYYKV